MQNLLLGIIRVCRNYAKHILSWETVVVFSPLSLPNLHTTRLQGIRKYQYWLRDYWETRFENAVRDIFVGWNNNNKRNTSSNSNLAKLNLALSLVRCVTHLGFRNASLQFVNRICKLNLCYCSTLLRINIARQWTLFCGSSNLGQLY